LPFFGPIERARVITFGLNPSTDEFTEKRKWSRVDDAKLPDELVNYWTNEQRTPLKWFKPWETVLSELGVSYAADAAHIDLSPRATNCRKGELRSLFISMLRTDAPIWIEALGCAARCKLILAAGSATNESCGYINEFILHRLSHTGVRLLNPWQRGHGPGQTAFHTICLPGSLEDEEARRRVGTEQEQKQQEPGIPFFFCSTGPSSRKQGTDVLVAACRKNMGDLKKYLAPPVSHNS